MNSNYSDHSLTLRDVEEKDLNQLAILANNKDIWINLRDVFPFPYTLEDAEHWFKQVKESPHILCLTILLDDKVSGVISLDFKPDVYKKTAEIGYWIGEAAWGKGIATAAVKQVTDYAFQEFKLARLEAKVFGWNPASKKVLEKCGYKLEGTLRNNIYKDGRLTDEFIYSILPSDLKS